MKQHTLNLQDLDHISRTLSASVLALRDGTVVTSTGPSCGWCAWGLPGRSGIKFHLCRAATYAHSCVSGVLRLPFQASMAVRVQLPSLRESWKLVLDSLPSVLGAEPAPGSRTALCQFTPQNNQTGRLVFVGNVQLKRTHHTNPWHCSPATNFLRPHCPSFALQLLSGVLCWRGLCIFEVLLKC